MMSNKGESKYHPKMDSKEKKVRTSYTSTQKKITPFGVIDYKKLYESIENDPAYQYVKKHFISRNPLDKDTTKEKP